MRTIIQVALLLTSLVAFGAVTNQQTLPVDSVVIGRPSPAADPQIQFKGTTHKIKSNRTTNRIQFSNDGTNFKNLGSGSGAGGGINLLQDLNFDFEQGTSNWTSSGGTFAVESAAPLFEVQSVKWDSSASGQTLSSSLKVIERGFIGRKCQAEMYYKWASGTSGDLKFQVTDQVPNVLAEVSLNPTTGSSVAPVFITFDCPLTATDQLRARLISTVSNAAEITIDNVFVGSGRNSINVSQAELTASAYYAATPSCNSVVDSASYTDFPTVTQCPAITVVSSTQPVDATDNNTNGLIKFTSLRAGTYRVTVYGQMEHPTANTSASFRIRDSAGNFGQGHQLNTNAANSHNLFMATATFTYSQDQSNLSFILQAVETGAGSMTVTNDGGGAGTSRSTQFIVEKFPTSSAEAINMETSGWRVDANIGGAVIGLGGADLATYTEMTDAGMDIVQNAGSLNVQIPCSGTNPSTGLTCAAGSESVGVVFDLPSAQDVMACVSFSHGLQAAAASTINTTFQIVETPNNAQTINQEGKSRVNSSMFTPSVEIHTPIRLCGTFAFTSAGKKTLRLMYEQDIAGSVTTNVIYADRNTSIGQRDVHWEVFPLNQQMPAPVFTEIKKKVESGATGERIERAQINISSSSAGSIVSQSGTWLSGVTVSATQATLPIVGGTFSSAPACTCGVDNDTIGVCNFAAATTTSQVKVSIVRSSTEAARTGVVNIICMGPK